MKTYRSKKAWWIVLLVVIFLLLSVIIFFFEKERFMRNPLILLPILAPIGLILWVFFDTVYKIEGQILKYRSGFLKGIIEIGKIREIVKGKTLWFGIKPGLATNGLIIKYNRFDEVYISPENNDDMISDIIKINPGIRVVGDHQITACHRTSPEA